MTNVEQTELCAAIAAFAAANIASQCELVLQNGLLVLRRRGGRKIVIDGAAYDIPAEGVSIGAATTLAGNLYYIYASVSDGALILEQSTVGHVQSTVSGIEIKSGDESRTLVGMAYVIQDNTWPTSPALVASWYNRRALALGSSTGSISVSSMSLQVVTTSTTEIGFVCWDDEIINLNAAGYADCAKGAAAMVTIDASPVGAYASGDQPQASLSPTYAGTLLEGYHSAGIALCAPNGGTSTGVIGFGLLVSGHN